MSSRMAILPRRVFVQVGLVLATIMYGATGSRADITPQQVDDAVDKAVAYLLSQQKPDGSWENGPKPKADPPGQNGILATPYVIYGGETAIITYALLAAGQNSQSPPMKKAIDWLVTQDLHGTYAVALRSQVWNLIPEKQRTKEVIIARDRDRDFVLYSRIQKGNHAGFYEYKYGADNGASLNPRMQPLDKSGAPDTWYDRSNSQYGVLGAWALEQAGAEIPTKYWEEEDAAWKKAQFADGSWNYTDVAGNDPKFKLSSCTMTSAGLATLFITQDYIMRATPHLFDSCKGGISSPNIEKGLAWMDRHVADAIGRFDGWYFYGMYGIERIGVASGRKYFGTIDWYQTASEKLVRAQFPDGSFNKTFHDTCFTILFLVRGRAPVMMNKLLYANSAKRQTDPWNERPRDAANLSKWMGKRSLEGFLNWQIVNLQVPVDELHDAPILYITGSEEINLGAADIEKLRLFVEQGGMILGNADCGSKIFSTSFKKLGSKLFPKYEFRTLGLSHPIFDEQFHGKNWKTRVQLEGLTNGVRELMLLIPLADPGKAWQTEAFKIREEQFQLGGNIFLYATGRENLRHKGETYIVHQQGDAAAGSISVARLQLGENWDPEPGAWRRFAAIMHNTHGIDLKVETVKLGTGDLARHKIAALTGTTKLKLDDAQRKELKDFVEGGGTLIVDSAGGSADFADAAEAELKQIFGPAGATALAAPLPASHAIFTDPKWKIETMKYRLFARQVLVGNARDPRLRAIPQGDRLGVFYSREDLTAGLVGEQVDGIVGYDPAVAVQLMANMVRYASTGG